MNYTMDELDTAVRTVLGEARGEPEEGQIAVAWVIRNRVETPGWWGESVGEVCRKPWQFSCWNSGDMNGLMVRRIAKTSDLYLKTLDLTLGVFRDAVEDPTRGATMYKRTGTPASWDKAVKGFDPVVIGHHSFWRVLPNGVVSKITLDPPVHP